MQQRFQTDSTIIFILSVWFFSLEVHSDSCWHRDNSWGWRKEECGFFLLLVPVEMYQGRRTATAMLRARPARDSTNGFMLMRGRVQIRISPGLQQESQDLPRQAFFFQWCYSGRCRLRHISWLALQAYFMATDSLWCNQTQMRQTGNANSPVFPPGCYKRTIWGYMSKTELNC